MTGVTWLHLSDWHQKGKDFDRKIVLRALLKDIRERNGISPALEKIDFVIFSGDVAFGGKREEYEAAKEQFFKPLLDACGLGPEQLFIVPGNHDLDRDEFHLLPHDLIEPLSTEKDVQDWLTEDRKRSRLLEPFREFASFARDYTKQDSSDYANVRMINIDDIKIALLGLNSAWMCGRNKSETGDYGLAIVGEPQIFDALIEISGAALKIAVLHHPFNWLNEFDRNRVENLLRQDCDFILHGHQHDPKVEITSGTDGDCVIIPAGASYDRRVAENPRYANSYNFVHFDLDTGKGAVYLRRWSDHGNRWREDIDLYPLGSFEFSYPFCTQIVPIDITKHEIAIDKKPSDLVFICYARVDNDFATKLAGNLKRRGVPVWLDIWNIPSGADWDKAIDIALDKCSNFLIILSPDSVDSNNVRSELQVALEDKKHIVPVLYRACRVPRSLKLIQFADFSNYDSDNLAALDQIVEALDLDSKEQIINISGLWKDNSDNDEAFFVQKDNSIIGIYDLGKRRKVGYYIGKIVGLKFEYRWSWYNKIHSGHGVMHSVNDDHKTLLGRYWDEDGDTGDVMYEYVDDQLPIWLSENDLAKLWVEFNNKVK